VRLPGASGKNPLIGVVQATGSAGGPDFSLVYFLLILVLYGRSLINW
jgi:hypothetical protein